LSKELKEGWRIGQRIEAPRIVFSAMPVEGKREYLIRQIIVSPKLGDLMLDMPPRLIKAAYDKCMEREKAGYTPVGG
jgi:hypothetical protein